MAYFVPKKRMQLPPENEKAPRRREAAGWVTLLDTGSGKRAGTGRTRCRRMEFNQYGNALAEGQLR